MAEQTIIERFNQLERQILVHSYLYYGLDKNIIGDSEFDHMMYYMVELMGSNPDDFSKSVYYVQFKNFEGGTGSDLDYNRPEIINIATRVLGGR